MATSDYTEWKEGRFNGKAFFIRYCPDFLKLGNVRHFEIRSYEGIFKGTNFKSVFDRNPEKVGIWYTEEGLIREGVVLIEEITGKKQVK